MGTPLVGKQHEQFIDNLYDRFMRLGTRENTSEAPIVVLEGVSGVGKSRIIRELYSKIRKARDDEYWPALKSPADENYSPLSIRKQLGPPIKDFVWKADALPTFGWWEFTGEQMSTGAAVNMESQAEAVINAHAKPVTLAKMEHVGLFGRLKNPAVTAYDDVRKMSGEELTDWILGQLVSGSSEVVPGLKLGMKWIQGGYRAVKQAKQDQQAVKDEIAQDEEVAAHSSRMTALLAESLLGMASHEVPGVIVIEDMHLMGESFIAFLEQIISQQPAPILVVGTAWPDAETRGKSQENTKAYRNWRATALSSGHAEVLSLQPPSQSARIEIVRTWAPNISTENAEQLTELVQNPLALELIMTSKATKLELRKNNGDLSSGYITKVPQELTGIYRQRLDELDDEVRKSLAAVAGTIPGDHRQRTWPFIRDHIAEAIGRERNEILADEGFGNTLATTLRSLEVDPTSQAWLVPTGVAETFREALMAEVAAKHLDDDLGILEDIRTEILWHLGSWLANQSDDDLEMQRTQETLVISQWYLALLDDEPIIHEYTAKAALSAAYRVAESHAEKDDYREAALLFGNVLHRVPPQIGSRNYRLLTGSYLHWIQASKRDENDGYKTALDEAYRLAERARQALPANAPDHVDWLFTLGLLHESLGQNNNAIRVFDEAFAHLPSINGSTTWTPLEVAQSRVNVYEKAGRGEEALRILIDLVNEVRAAPEVSPHFRNRLTDRLEKMLIEHDGGAPEDYFDETDEQLRARHEAQQNRAEALWTALHNDVLLGRQPDPTDHLARMYDEFDVRLEIILDKSCKTLALELITQNRFSAAATFIAAWLSFRPDPFQGSMAWLLAWALEGAGEDIEAVKVHERGLDHWRRQAGATATDQAIFRHRHSLNQLQGDLEDAVTLTYDVVAALSAGAQVPEPHYIPNRRPNWLLEYHHFADLSSRPWAEEWVSIRGDFLRTLVAELQPHPESLPTDVLQRIGIWETLGNAAAAENPKALWDLHLDLRNDADFGPKTAEAKAAKILAQRLEKLETIRKQRERQG